MFCKFVVLRHMIDNPKEVTLKYNDESLDLAEDSEDSVAPIEVLSKSDELGKPNESATLGKKR